jgi:hypothetical protein
VEAVGGGWAGARRVKAVDVRLQQLLQLARPLLPAALRSQQLSDNGSVGGSGGPGQRDDAREEEQTRVSIKGQRGREKGVGGELHLLATLMVITMARLPPASSRRREELRRSVVASWRGMVWSGEEWEWWCEAKGEAVARLL